MKNLTRNLYILISLSLLAGCVTTATSKNLLDPTLSEFHNIYDYGDAQYVDGELVLQATKNWFFMTQKTYADFILTAEVLLPDVTEYSNSGIMFRSQILNSEKGPMAIGYQVDIDPSDRKWTGGLFDQSRRLWLHPIHSTRSHPDEHFLLNYTPTWTTTMANAYKHLEWNHIRIECRGNEIKIYVNDVLTTHVLDNTDAEGYIGFQHHGSKTLRETGQSNNVVRFRNINVIEF